MASSKTRLRPPRRWPRWQSFTGDFFDLRTSRHAFPPAFSFPPFRPFFFPFPPGTQVVTPPGARPAPESIPRELSGISLLHHCFGLTQRQPNACQFSFASALPRRPQTNISSRHSFHAPSYPPHSCRLCSPEFPRWEGRWRVSTYRSLIPLFFFGTGVGGFDSWPPEVHHGSTFHVLTWLVPVSLTPPLFPPPPSLNVDYGFRCGRFAGNSRDVTVFHKKPLFFFSRPSSCIVRRRPL